MKAAAENQRRLETEEELAERTRLLKNKGFSGKDSIYYIAEVSSKPDSLLSIISLKGKANRSGNISTFEHTAVALDGQVARGTMNGNFFRSDQAGDKGYRLYCYNNTTGSVHAYLLEPATNALVLTPVEPSGNYRYNLLKQKSFAHTLNNEDRFFKTIKSAKINDNPELDSLFNNAGIYRDQNNLLPESLSSPFLRLWLYGQHGSSNVLLTSPTDSTRKTITLSGKYVNPTTEINISSVFLNDSIWKQSTVKESMIYDHPHLVVFQKDSIIRTFRYNENFAFNLMRTDTIRTRQNYPQYYPELKDSIFEMRSETFNMNNKKAYWRYLLSYTNKSTSADIKVRVSNKDLMSAANDQLIFRLPGAGTPKTARIDELLTPAILFEGTDLNYDGTADLSFRKGTDVNNNPIYVVYLYEPASGRFKRTPQLDGRSVFKGIIRDTIHKKLLYSGYIDNGQMSVSVITPDPIEVKNREIYWTTGNKKAPTVHYQKLVNNSITEKRSPLLDSLPLQGSDLKTGLVKWILNRQKTMK